VQTFQENVNLVKRADFAWNLDARDVTAEQLHTAVVLACEALNVEGTLRRAVREAVGCEVALAIGRALLQNLDLRPVTSAVEGAIMAKGLDSRGLLCSCNPLNLSFGSEEVGFFTRNVLQETDGPKGNRALGEIFDSIIELSKRLDLPVPCAWRGKEAVSAPGSVWQNEYSGFVWTQRVDGQKYSDEGGPFRASPRQPEVAEMSMGCWKAVQRAELDSVAVVLAYDERIGKGKAGAYEEVSELGKFIREDLLAKARRAVDALLLHRVRALAESAWERTADMRAAKEKLSFAFSAVLSRDEQVIPAESDSSVLAGEVVIVVTGIDGDRCKRLAAALADSGVWSLDLVESVQE
jgi:hypothetical protein